MNKTKYLAKQLFVLFVSLAFVLTSSSLCFAQQNVTLSTTSATIAEGETAEIAVEVSDIDTINSIYFYLLFDGTAFDAENSTITIEDSPLKNTLEPTGKVDKRKNAFSVVGTKLQTQTVNITEKVKIATLRLKAKEGITHKTYPLSFLNVELFKADTEGNKDFFNVTELPGSITVTASGGSTGGGSTGGGSPGGGRKTVSEEIAEPDKTNNDNDNITTPIIDDNANATTDTFTDLQGVEWSVESIDALVKAGIVNGVTNTTFEPNRSITRAEFCKLIATTFGFSEMDASSSYIDVSQTDWYYATVMAAAKAGVVTGYTDGDFRPDNQITREEMAAMLIRAFKAAGIDTPQGEMTFADVGQMDDWSKDYIASLSQMGIVSGKGDNNFAPKDNLTRAEAAKVIYSAFKLVNAK